MVGWYVRWFPRVHLPLFALFLLVSALMQSWRLTAFLFLFLALNGVLWWAAQRWHREAGG